MLKLHRLAGIAFAAAMALTAGPVQAAFVWSFGDGSAGRSNGPSRKNADTPDHALDPCDLPSGGSCQAGTPAAFTLFKSSDRVALADVAQGWFQTGGDVTVPAYAGGGEPGRGLTKDGWRFIGNFADPEDGAAAVDPGGDPGGRVGSSSYWLIGAYNTRLHAESSPWGANDALLKIVSSAGSAGPADVKVPEPSSLALAALALLLACRYRPGGRSGPAGMEHRGAPR